VKKYLVLVTAILTIASLFLSACTKKTPTSQTTLVTGVVSTTTSSAVTTTAPTSTALPTTTTATTDPNAPQYGGTLRFAWGTTLYFDPLISSIGGGQADMVYEKLVEADWAKGPEGTNEFSFGTSWVAPQYQKGQIAESWQIVDLNTMVINIRQGIRFQNKAPANGKELTANDVVYTYQRGQKDTRFVFYSFVDWTNTAGLDKARSDAKVAGRTDAEFDAWVSYLKSVKYPFYSTKSCIAKDKWTVEYRMLNANKPIFEDAAWFFIESSEGAAYDMQNWRNSCGTGPWIVSDVVADSSVTWVKNPNYWMDDPVHPGNRLPYLDGEIGIIIPDAKVAQSALRTHKIDFMTVDWDIAIQMKSTNPEFLSRTISPTGAYVMFMRTDIAPFNDVRVRQAIAMGIDRDAIVRDYYKGNAFVDAWPVLPGLPAYTPRDQMPEDVRQLYEYHPDKAKALLAEAGYPNGITFDCQIAANAVLDIEHLTLLSEQWKTAGITVNVAPIEPGLGTTLVFTFAYKNAVYTWWGNSAPADAMVYANNGGLNDIYNFSHARDPLALQAMSTYAKITDSVEAYEFLRQEYLRTDKLVWQVPLPTRSAVTLWQPYLKGFKGEVSMGPSSQLGGSGRTKFLWFDQKIKAQYK
jgi:peptide/nickel transport system substrate-binding protein